MKFAEVFPAAIVTDAGGLAALLLLLRLTIIPPFGAADDIVAVPVAEVPPTTAVGLTLMDANVGGLIVSVADRVTVPSDPVTVAVVCVVTTTVVTANVADELPDAILMLAGAEALFELLLKPTVKPPVGARPVSVTVPVEEAPPLTVAGERDTDWSVIGFTVSTAD